MMMIQLIDGNLGINRLLTLPSFLTPEATENAQYTKLNSRQEVKQQICGKVGMVIH